MKFVPSYALSVFSEEEYPEKMNAVDRVLDNYRCEGTFAGFDGKPLYYTFYLVQNSRGAIVIVHGLSEFTKKYHEFTWYLLNQGYDVFIYDQRCHGRSCRLTDKPGLIHVEHYDDYRKDLHLFVKNVVRKATKAPLYMYAHSMGGATAVRYLAHYPRTFRKTILAAPMIDPLTGGVPPLIARVGLSAYVLFGDWKKQFWSSHEFDPNHPFEKASDTSYARFRRCMDIRIAEECYRTTPLTVRWVQQSVMQKWKLTSKRFLRKIRTPILMFSAENDKVVCSKAQNKFAKNCPVCRQVILPNTTHAMANCTQAELTEQLRQLVEFFG